MFSVDDFVAPPKAIYPPKPTTVDSNLQTVE